MYSVLSYKDWNSIDKPFEVDCKAEEGDIVLKIGDLYGLCQTKNGYNNIVVFSNISSISNVRAMLTFMLILFFDYAIFYVRVECSSGRYNFLLKNTLNPCYRNINGRDIRYYKIEENIGWIKKAIGD